MRKTVSLRLSPYALFLLDRATRDGSSRTEAIEHAILREWEPVCACGAKSWHKLKDEPPYPLVCLECGKKHTMRTR